MLKGYVEGFIASEVTVRKAGEPALSVIRFSPHIPAEYPLVASTVSVKADTD